MRVASLFKRVLGLGAVSVARVEVVERRGEQVVEVEITRRRTPDVLLRVWWAVHRRL
jgi:hypothetical protein